MVKKTLYFGNPAYLSTRNKQLIIKVLSSNEERSIAIEDVAIIILDNQQITITQKVFQVCISNNVAIMTCNHNHMPQGMMFSWEQNTVQTQRYREQINMSEPLRKNLWKQTIEAKINNQALLLKYFDKEYTRVRVLKYEVLSGDTTNAEGHASSIYWRTLLGNNFIRDRVGMPPNSHLNYGYAILRAIVARALASTGLHLSFGIFHKNKYNPFCLADDIMEPFRPFCDMLVYQMYANGDISDTDITKNQKTILLKLPTVDVDLDGMMFPLLESLSRTTNSLYECIIGKSKKIIYPKFYEKKPF